MSKKTRKFLRNIVPEGARLVKDLPEIPPVFVAVKAIGSVVMGLAPKTISNWFTQGIGPRPYYVNGRPYLKYEEIIEMFETGVVK